MVVNRSCVDSEAGTSLVEVLIALTILVSLALPISKFRAYLLTGGASGRELVHIVAVSTMEELNDRFYRSGSWSSRFEDNYYEAMGHYFDRTWILSDPGSDMGTEKALLRRATVTVTCLDCGGNPTVEVVALVGKVY